MVYLYYAEEAQKSDDGFECPTDTTKRLDKNGQTIEHPRFAHKTDCQKFYVCQNGTDKRELQCEDGKVFNNDSGACDVPENVPDW